MGRLSRGRLVAGLVLFSRARHSLGAYSLLEVREKERTSGGSSHGESHFQHTFFFEIGPAIFADAGCRSFLCAVL